MNTDGIVNSSTASASTASDVFSAVIADRAISNVGGVSALIFGALMLNLF